MEETTVVKIAITMTIKGNRVLVNVSSDDIHLDQKEVKAITDVLIEQLVERT
jgi:hypothetical protein